MRIIRNGPKQRIYLSASERRALAYALRNARCPQCNRHHLVPESGYSAVSCGSCGLWANLGKDFFVTFAKKTGWNGNSTTRVQKIITAQERVLYYAPVIFRAEDSYGKDVHL